jgi:hypothetical protein
VRALTSTTGRESWGALPGVRVAVSGLREAVVGALAT